MSVRSYDPAEEEGRSPNQGKVKACYEKLLERGEEDKAQELREESSVSAQMRIVQDIRDFDPVHDSVYSTSRVGILKAYEALLEQGEEEKAEELRYTPDLNSQKRMARRVREELGEGSGTYNQGGI